jgi:hypothetical protein
VWLNQAELLLLVNSKFFAAWMNKIRLIWVGFAAKFQKISLWNSFSKIPFRRSCSFGWAFKFRRIMVRESSNHKIYFFLEDAFVW